MNKIVLIFPPQFEPFQPYLSLPILAGHLKARGFDVDAYDLNIDYFDYILTADYIYKTVANVRDGLNLSVLKASEFVLERLESVKSVLKSRDNFVNTVNYRFSMNTLNTALEIVSAVYTPSRISLFGARCGTSNFDSECLVDAVNDPTLNLFNEYVNEQVLPIFEKNTPDFIGFSLVVHDQLPCTLTLCREIQRLFPETHISFGGALVSRMGHQIAESPYLSGYFDSLVIGEGEETLCELVEVLEKGSDISDVQGILVPSRKDKFKKRQRTGETIAVMPDFSCLPLDRYFSPILVLPFLTSRGCYWGKCAFCCHWHPVDNYDRSSIGKVVNELSTLKEEYGTQYFSFSDEAIPAKRMKSFASHVIDTKLDIRWFTFARMESAFSNPEMCKLIYQAGCRTLMFGFESAVQRIVDLMNKGTKVSNAKTILEACKQASIAVRLDVMIGFPTETRVESDRTLEFLKRNRDIIDTPFSITPLSVFELHRDSAIMRDPQSFGVVPKGSLKGDLDYQIDYRLSNQDKYVNKIIAYEKYLSTLKSSFYGPILCPESKAHAFLMKSLFDEGLVFGYNSDASKDGFSYDSRLLFYPGVERRDVSNGNSLKHLLCNLGNGMEIEMDSFCCELIDMIKSSSCVKEIESTFINRFETQESDLISSLRIFIHFLLRNDFIYVGSTQEGDPRESLNRAGFT